MADGFGGGGLSVLLGRKAHNEKPNTITPTVAKTVVLGQIMGMLNIVLTQSTAWSVTFSLVVVGSGMD
jgi:hypothetical protein